MRVNFALAVGALVNVVTAARTGSPLAAAAALVAIVAALVTARLPARYLD